MALNGIEEILLRERNALKLLILRENTRLSLGKRPVNIKISNFVRKIKQDKDVWSKFLDTLDAEDLSRNLNVYEWKGLSRKEVTIAKRYLRLNSATRDVLSKFKVTLREGTMSEGPRVTVAQGELRGRAATTPGGRGYFSFQGIPYARPPIGSLRFKAPEYPLPWSGVRDATTPGPKCAQMDPYRPKKFEGSEDCLHLNVYTPQLPETAGNKGEIPVIVYVHGGRYLAGYGAYYQPDYLIEKDVILVTINYRVSILGFLALNIPEVPGNAALKDVVFALRWIKKNISKFNGDPDNVTVMGESAGAGSVSCLLVSPMAEGLFHKMILESGTFLNNTFLSREDPVGKAKHFAKITGKDLSDPNELLLYLQTVPVEQLADTVCDIMRSKLEPQAFFSPIVEQVYDGVEAFLIEEPAKSLKEGRYQKVPMIFGYNSHEGALFIEQNKNGNIKFINEIGEFILQFINADGKSVGAKKQFIAEVMKFYFGNKQISEEVKKEFVDLCSDITFVKEFYTFIDFILLYQKNYIWLYNFSYLGSLNGPKMKSLGLSGACHSDQLAYQFYRPQKKHLKLNENDQRIIQFFSESCANFAKYGNPSTFTPKVDWPPMSREKKFCMGIGEEFQLLVYPDGERMEFWKYVLDKYSTEKSKL